MTCYKALFIKLQFVVPLIYLTIPHQPLASPFGRGADRREAERVKTNIYNEIVGSFSLSVASRQLSQRESQVPGGNPVDSATNCNLIDRIA